MFALLDIPPLTCQDWRERKSQETQESQTQLPESLLVHGPPEDSSATLSWCPPGSMYWILKFCVTVLSEVLIKEKTFYPYILLRISRDAWSTQIWNPSFRVLIFIKAPWEQRPEIRENGPVMNIKSLTSPGGKCKLHPAQI